MHEGKTAGELSLKAASDLTHYDGREVAEAQMHDLIPNLLQSARDHREKIDEEEYFVIMVRAKDPLIYGLVRQKFYCWMHMPSPRPEQAVFLYNKATDGLKFLWSLPPAKVMAAISESTLVAKRWERTKSWCDAFFDGSFWTFIRKQHDIKHLSEIEMLHSNREELIKSGCKEGEPLTTDAFDFSKIQTNQVVNPA